MFKNAKTQPYFLGLGAAVALLGALAAPASAQSIIIINNGSTPYYGRNHRPTVGNFIYGSPIATPIPVNPVTGHTPTQSRFSRPHRRRRRRVYNSTFINPVLVNPTIIKTPRNKRRYRNSRRRIYRQSGSRILINSPW
ncbi:hypothetical protein NIES267_51920 [Calothrix parasitica NIES-267]|uniref:Uncharacterized protein n=1 Tax=Calothrix parasitica NIES-267 TaxID=1973488 RepID=A0A1Z4LX20_9CYAN|nr:hypothetical protein NIES267_51920 [Calothrix parasitica NIES-267]